MGSSYWTARKGPVGRSRTDGIIRWVRVAIPFQPASNQSSGCISVTPDLGVAP